LTLHDDIPALGDGHDGSRLDGRGFIESVAEDAPDQVVLQTHGVEGGENLYFLTGFELQIAILL